MAEAGVQQPDERMMREVLASTVDVAEAAGVPYAFMGGIAMAAFGRVREIPDIDLFVRPEDARPVLERFAAAGFRTEERDPEWLYKAVRDGVLVDVIFRSTPDLVLDDEMAARVRRRPYDGLELTVLAPEDLLVIKTLVVKEHRPDDWFDALALVEAGGLDWDYLLRRAGAGPERVLSLLLFARSSGFDVPDHVVRVLFERCARHEPDEYLLARVQDALARDERTAELELDVAVEGDVVVVSGVVATPERCRALSEVVAETAPGRTVRNLASVAAGDGEPSVEHLP